MTIHLDESEYKRLKLGGRVKAIKIDPDPDPDPVQVILVAVVKELGAIRAELRIPQEQPKIDTSDILQAIEKVKPEPQAGKWQFTVVRDEKGLIDRVEAVKQ